MYSVVWEYTLAAGLLKLEMPKGAEILTVKTVGGKITLWALVNPQNNREIREFTMQGTGWHLNLNDIKKYIGTVLTNGGQFVWHVFELK